MDSKWQEILDRCECGKGWYGIVAELMEKIEEVYQKHNINMKDDFQLLQIKQKLGELVVYTNSSLKEEIAALKEEASLKSTQTCEECGEDGYNYRVKHCRWFTLCEKCMDNEGCDTFNE